MGQIAALGGGSGGREPAAAVPSNARSYNLVLRKGQSVQEVGVVALCSRDEMRALVAETLAAQVAAA